MFGFIGDGIQAYNQVGMFIGALICLALGGLVLGNSIYWRIHAFRASGTIIGVVDQNGTYAPVYRYVQPDGQTREAKSDTSSSSMRGKETGRVVPLMISAHDPGQARVADNYLFDLIGILLILPGVVLGYTALTAYPVTWLTWIIAVAMLVYLAERAHRVLIPKTQRLSIAAWRKQRGLDSASTFDPADVKPIEKIIATPDAQQTSQTRSRNNRKAAPIVGFFVVVLLCAGVYQAMRMFRLETSGFRAPGVVVRLQGESNSGSNSSYSYHAIVRYRTEGNATVEFKDSVGSNPPSHRPGDKVTVLYLPDTPRQDAIIDRDIVWNWMIPGLLLLGVALLAWLMAAMLRDGPARKPATELVAETSV